MLMSKLNERMLACSKQTNNKVSNGKIVTAAQYQNEKYEKFKTNNICQFVEPELGLISLLITSMAMAMAMAIERTTDMLLVQQLEV